MKEIFYPYGTQYYRAPTPMPDEWEVDIPELKRAGYTHIQLRPQWRWHEAVRHQYQFDDMNRLFELAEENGLRVILKPMLETAPDWVFTELNGTRIGFHGVPLTPFAHGAYYVGGWWPCFENTLVREAALDFVKVLTLRYCDHPALWIYDAWNEPRARPIESCQCGYCQESYRRWLKERFGTIDDLNDFYGKRWTSFESIAPPVSGHDYVEMALWRDWAAGAITGHVEAVIAQIRSIDPHRAVMFHRGTIDVVTDIAWDAGDDIKNAQADCDWYGYSCAIEFHPENPQDYALVTLQGDWMRRVDPNNWCHEFYPRRANWERSPTIHHLQQQSFMTIGAGAKGFTWWQYRSERVGDETNGFGLVEINGQPTIRSEYAEALAGFFKEHGAALVESRAPKAPVAVLYDRSSDMISRMTVYGNYFTRLPEGFKVSPYKSAFSGAHFLHWHHNIERDIVLPGDELSGYRFLHVCAAEMIDEQTAVWLTEFVQNGGFLFVEYPFACRDENTWVSRERPNHNLSALTGCVETGRVQVDGRADDRVVWKGVAEVVAVGMHCDLEATTGKVIAEWADGKPAIVLHAKGRGAVLTSGINLSQACERGQATEAIKAFRQVLGMAEIRPLVSLEYAGRLIVQRRVISGSHMVFLYNMGKEPLEMPEWIGTDTRTCWGELQRSVDGGHLLPGHRMWIGLVPSQASNLYSEKHAGAQSR